METFLQEEETLSAMAVNREFALAILKKTKWNQAGLGF